MTRSPSFRPTAPLPALLIGLSLLAPAALAQATDPAPAPAPASQTSSVEQTFDRIDRLQQQSAARQRAMNLARNTVVTLNGGLGVYMPAACMFASGASASCLVQSDAQGFRFRFNGGAPGWQQLGLPPTLSSEVLISPDGRSVVQVAYNGPLR
jgi:hypothetical protein